VLTPVTPDDLLKGRMAIKAWADATFGLMGRSPDFLNTAVMAFAAARDFFAQVMSTLRITS
jgi:aromatic ring hydroxylase